MNAIWIAIIAISILGLFFGIILGYASRRFAVEGDPVVEKSMNCYRKASVGNAVTLAVAPTLRRWAVRAKKLTVVRRVAKP